MALIQTSITKLKTGDLTTVGRFDGVVKRTAKFIYVRFQIGKSRDYLPEYKFAKTKKLGVYTQD